MLCSNFMWSYVKDLIWISEIIHASTVKFGNENNLKIKLTKNRHSKAEKTGYMRTYDLKFDLFDQTGLMKGEI